MLGTQPTVATPELKEGHPSSVLLGILVWRCHGWSWLESLPGKPENKGRCSEDGRTEIWRLCLYWYFWVTRSAAAKSLHLCPPLCNPMHGSPPSSPSLGFSRQEHWSGLPFPSPMHESETWKCIRSVVFDSSRPHGLQPTRLLRPWDFPGKSTGVGCHCLLRYLSIGLS